MLYNAQSVVAKACGALLRNPLFGVLSGILMKSVSFMIKRDMHVRKNVDVSVFEYLRDAVKCADLEFALSLGTPGPHRKPVIQLSTREGSILGYAKVGWNEATNSLVKNEADTIKSLFCGSFENFVMPSVLNAGWWHSRYIAILSSPESRLLPAAKTLNLQYINTINELAGLHIRRETVQESAFWSELLIRVKKIKNGHYRGILERKAIPWIENSLGDARLPFHMSHGDFAPWNSFIRDGRLYLYDWEYARRDAPPGWDLFHFIYQTNVYLKSGSTGKLYEAIASDGNKNMTKIYWEKLGIGEDTVNTLFLLYIIDRLSFIASEEAENYQELNQLSKIVFLIVKD
jgi:hypothetical protein